MSALAAIHVARKQLGLDEETYRAVLVRVTGKSSAGAMSEAERQAVVDELRRQGFTKRASGSRKHLEGKFAPKLRALWIAAWNLGVVPHRTDKAMHGFVKRQTGVDSLRFVHHSADASAVIEALKARMAREAGVDWSTAGVPDHARAFGYRIAWAQWRILMRSQGISSAAFWHAVTGIIGRDVAGRELSRAEWIVIMNAFGERVRAARKVRARREPTC
jgi:phage gp16-like protein